MFHFTPSPAIAWLMLLAVIVVDALYIYFSRASNGGEHLNLLLLAFIFGCTWFLLMIWVVPVLGLGVAWTIVLGVSTVAGIVIGWTMFREALSGTQLFWAAVTITGAIGLQQSSGGVA